MSNFTEGRLSTIPSTREALRMARELGCTVLDRHGHHSQVSVMHPRWTRPIMVISTAKDSPRILTVALRRLLLARDEEKGVDIEMVQDAVSDAQLLEASEPEPEAVDVTPDMIERQSAPTAGEERISIDEAAALVERPVKTIYNWLMYEKLDVSFNRHDLTIAASGLDVLDFLSRTRQRKRRGEGANFMPAKPTPPALPAPTQRIIEMNTPAPQQPSTTVTVQISAEDRALAQAMGMTPEAFVRVSVEQATKRLREKLRALFTEAA